MADKKSESKEHNRGQRDGAAYKKQGAIDRVFSPRYHERGSTKDRADYQKGHKNGRQ